METLITIIFSILPMVILGGILIKIHIKHTNKLKEQYKLCPTVSVELHDLLCVVTRSHKKYHNHFLAVYKDTFNNRYYVSGMRSYLANPLISYVQVIGKEPNIKVLSHNRKQIEPQAKGRLYIAKELGRVTVNGDTAVIDNIMCTYKGSIHQPSSLRPTGNHELRSSVETNKILEEINNATIIEGLIEFDVDMYQG